MEIGKHHRIFPPSQTPHFLLEAPLLQTNPATACVWFMPLLCEHLPFPLNHTVDWVASVNEPIHWPDEAIEDACLGCEECRPNTTIRILAEWILTSSWQ